MMVRYVDINQLRPRKTIKRVAQATKGKTYRPKKEREKSSLAEHHIHKLVMLHLWPIRRRRNRKYLNDACTANYNNEPRKPSLAAASLRSALVDCGATSSPDICEGVNGYLLVEPHRHTPRNQMMARSLRSLVRVV